MNALIHGAWSWIRRCRPASAALSVANKAGKADPSAHRSVDEGTHDRRTDDGHADVCTPASTDAEADAGAAFTNTDTDVRPASHAHVAGAVAATHTLCSITSSQLRAISKAHYVNM